MDYGRRQDAPEPAERDEYVWEPQTLAQRCLAATITIGIAYAAVALGLLALNPHPRGPVSVIVWQDDTPRARPHHGRYDHARPARTGRTHR
jgi:hypothetical protein